jgi:hypothetical protein
MKVMIMASWDNQAKLPELALKIFPIFSNPPADIKKLCSYEILGKCAVYSIYEVEDEVDLIKHVSTIGLTGFNTDTQSL